MKPSLILLLSFFLFSYSSGDEPTGFRDWTSAKGQSLNANITALNGDQVTLKKADGSSMETSISLFSATDIEFIRSHFAKKQVAAAPAKVSPKGKGKGKGKPGKGKRKKVAIATVKSGPGTKYYHYVPSTAVANPPALFWTSGGRPGTASDIERFVSAAELTGVVLVSCGDSNNSNSKNGTVMDTNLKHAFNELSIDQDRLITSGTSGGAARCFYNAARYDAIGAIPSVGYIPDGTKPPRGGFYHVIFGAYDYNRYASAFAADKFGGNATVRINPGGHGTGAPQALSDGLIWVYTRHIYSARVNAAEVQQFEDRFIDYLQNTLASKPWKAYYWTNHLLNTCRVSGVNREKFSLLHKRLSADPENLRYSNANEDVVKFAMKYYAPVGPGSRYKHVTGGITKNIKKLISKHGDAPEIGEIVKQMGRKTDGG